MKLVPAHAASEISDPCGAWAGSQPCGVFTSSLEGAWFPHHFHFITSLFQPQLLALPELLVGFLGWILPCSRGWAGVPLSPTAFYQPGAIPALSRQQDLPLWCSTGPAGPVLALLPQGAEALLTSQLLWGRCWRDPAHSQGLELCCAGEGCSRGMQACSSLPGRASGLTWLPPASSTSRGCLVSHTALPGCPVLGRLATPARLGTSLGSLPLLPTQPWLSGRADEEERRDPSVGVMGSCCSRLNRVQVDWQDPAGLSASLEGP